MKEFTKEQLSQFNGKNGAPAYIAYKGKVYDVSDSFLWKDGNHQVLHDAGTDLTAAIEPAPHGDKILDKFPVVGVLRDARTSV